VGVTLSVREFRRQQVGCKLEAWRSDLIKCGRELQSRRAFRGSSFVDDSLRLLDRLTCRIGLIGQVKAGKSSLTNALACKPDMLPTDVNPFTTVVTNLHFGRTDVPADVAAEFTFFQANEWEQLAAGVRHIRELTERLVPGFDVEQLHKQVDALRRRSEQRLGAGLSALLGQKHVFSSLSSELLLRYVASNLSATETENKDAYSDIVKAADLYFASSDFGFPTTIIDTPGTNDPFLVRDEIARRALESAHVHIVVLTSRQAMSAADVALLRILQGLRKDRIVVFINRIDELGNIARLAPRSSDLRAASRGGQCLLGQRCSARVEGRCRACLVEKCQSVCAASRTARRLCRRSRRRRANGAEPIALLGCSSAARCCCGPYTGKPRGPRLEANIAIVLRIGQRQSEHCSARTRSHRVGGPIRR
jgi:Dynamin family